MHADPFLKPILLAGSQIQITIAAARAEQKNATKYALGMYSVTKHLKDVQIRGLQNVLEALEIELVRNGLGRIGGASDDANTSGRTTVTCHN